MSTGVFAWRCSAGVYHRRMTKKTTRNGGKSGAGKGSTPRTKSAGQRSGKPAKTGKSLPPWMPDLPPTGGGAKSSAPATRRAAPARTSGRFVDPHAQREAQRYDQPIASREAILGFLEAAEGPQTAEEIAGPLGLQAPDRFQALSKRLGAMVRDGQLVQNRRGGFAPVQHTALIAGTCTPGQWPASRGPLFIRRPSGRARHRAVRTSAPCRWPSAAAARTRNAWAP